MFYQKLRLALTLIVFKLSYPFVKFIRVKKRVGTFYSQDGQDLLVSAILFDKLEKSSNKLVIDIGANHPTKFSNSYFLEKYFGCKTLAIDPLLEFEELWKKYRPNAEFISVALGSKDDFININIPLAGDNMLSSLDGGFMKDIHKGQIEVRKIRVMTLQEILEVRKITEVLLMSIDVEGFELEVLRGIDFDKVRFSVIICENNSGRIFGSNAIREHIIQKGYVYYARVGWLDDVFVSTSIMSDINSSCGI